MRPFTSTISLEEARRRLDAAVTPIARTERVALALAAGRVAAQDVTSPIDVPPFARSAMDGYALVAADTIGATREQPARLRIVERIYTADEAEYCRRMRRPWRRFATRFAGKEAVMKSLGLGARGVNWTDIEILGRGKPQVRLSGKVAARAESLGVTRIEVSLTHGEDTAIAIAVAVGA